MAEQARVRIDLERTISPIDRRIFGGFIEHLGRCIYGGVYDEGSPLSDAQGFRKDVLELAKTLQMPLLRWPGGNFVSGYDWTDGIGPQDQRPGRPELAWKAVESNRFGTDEFIAYCRELGTEPYICVNMGTGTMDDARAWVEYCNGAGDTYWANKRRANGHEEPYNVRYWGLGNEVYGRWQIGHLSADDYVKKAIEFAKVMLWTDPSIELISCGEQGWQDWDRTVLAGLAPYVKYHSIHLYTGATDYTESVFQPHIAELALQTMHAEIERLRFRGELKHDTKVAYDEWNVWYRARGAESKLEERYDVCDAISVATFLNIFTRNSQVLAIGNLAQMVNVIAPMFTSPDGIFRQTIYFPLVLMAEQLQDLSLATWYQGPQVDVPETFGDGQPSRIAQMGPFDLVDVGASRSADRSTLVVSLVNRSATEAVETTIDLGLDAVGGEITRFEITGDSPSQINDFGAETVGTVQSVLAGDGSQVPVTLPPFSHTVLRIPITAV